MVAPRRILILVPHPDDEVVGCAIAATRARQAGSRLFSLYLTTGVPGPELLWPWQRRRHGRRVARRRAEAALAARRLGLEPVGFQDWPSRSLKSHLGAALNLTRTMIEGLGIDQLWVPAWEGAHQDHDIANFLASRLLSMLTVTEFAEYNLAGGTAQAQRFPATNGTETVIHLTAAERRLKREALALYRSERRYLGLFDTSTECLRPLPRHDYGSAPHPGRLFYQRFHWVPIRHPRLDFSSPAEVTAAITAFEA